MPDLGPELAALRLSLESALERLAAIEAAEAERNVSARRHALLLRLGELLRPKGSDWSRANRVAAALERFETTAWPRILSGARGPRDEAEEVMVELFQLPGRGPRKARALWDVFADAPAKDMG